MVSCDFQNTSIVRGEASKVHSRYILSSICRVEVSHPSAGLVPRGFRVRGKSVRDLCSHLQGLALPPGHLSSHRLIPGQGIILGIASSLEGCPPWTCIRASGSWKNLEQMPPGAWKSLVPMNPCFPGAATLGPGEVGASLHLFSRPGN